MVTCLLKKKEREREREIERERTRHDRSWKLRSPERSLQDHMKFGVKETGWAVDLYVMLLHR